MRIEKEMVRESLKRKRDSNQIGIVFGHHTVMWGYHSSAELWVTSGFPSMVWSLHISEVRCYLPGVHSSWVATRTSQLHTGACWKKSIKPKERLFSSSPKLKIWEGSGQFHRYCDFFFFCVGTVGSKEKDINFTPHSFMTNLEKIKEILYNS